MSKPSHAGSVLPVEDDALSESDLNLAERRDIENSMYKELILEGNKENHPKIFFIS